MAGLPEFDAPSAEAGPGPAGSAPGATVPEIIPPAKPARPETNLARLEVQPAPTEVGDEKDVEEEGRRGASSPKEPAPAPAIQIVPKAGIGTLKPEIRKPKIFVPGPAPDDPGPRLPDGDEPGTPLSRFRRPS